MKLKLVAVAVTSMLAAGVVNAAEVFNKDGNKLDLYGKVTGLHYFSDDAGSDGDKTYVRLGFKGETQINDQLTGYGQWEYEFKGNRSEAQGSDGNKTRLAYAGLKFDEFGSFDYGRNYGVAYDIGAWTDVLPEFGGDTWTQTDGFMTGRTTGVATYRNTDFFGLVDGLSMGIQYQGKNDRNDVRTSNGDGVGYSLGYSFAEGFSVIGAYSNSDRTNNQTADGKGEKAEAWAVGAKYDANNIYLATVYAETRNMTREADGSFANKTQNFEAMAQYQFDFGLRPSLSYVQSKGKDLAARGSFTGGNEDLQKYVEIGAYYYFNKNFNIYVDYQLNLIDKSNYSDSVGIVNGRDDQVAMAVTYQF